MPQKKRVFHFEQGGEIGGEGEGGGEGGEIGIHEKEYEQLSRDDASHFSLTGQILPSLGATARSNRHVHLRRFIVSPFDPRYRLFHSILFVSVFT